MPVKTDRRTERTRSALIQAFSSLILERRRYDEISICAIVERANTGRSTFYEHFRNKEEILAASLQKPFTALVQCITDRPSRTGLHQLLEHFWQHRHQARMMFTGSTRRAMRRALAGLMLDQLPVQDDASAVMSCRLICTALAEAQLGTLSVWLSGEISCTSAQLGATLIAISQASAQSTGVAILARQLTGCQQSR